MADPNPPTTPQTVGDKIANMIRSMLRELGGGPVVVGPVTVRCQDPKTGQTREQTLPPVTVEDDGK